MANYSEYYQVGGTLSLDNPSYIERKADYELYTALKGKKFCYVFNARQMGKSSLQLRVRNKLEQEGYKCVMISLDGLGTRGVTSEQWYYTFIKKIVDGFDLDIPNLANWWRNNGEMAPLQKLSDFICEKLLKLIQEDIVIFIDEIDSVRSLDFPTEDFFTFIRYCYNQRADNPNYKRLAFALFGVATPAQLIQDTQRTPFNIGTAIELTPFSLNEAQKLAQGLQGKDISGQIAAAIIQQVLFWTGGQPFLTQKICKSIAASSEDIPKIIPGLENWVDEFINTKIIQNWEYQDEPQHLRTIEHRIANSHEHIVKILNIYTSILDKKEIELTGSPEENELLLSGLVIRLQNKLQIYNPIYKHIFNTEWVARTMQNSRPYEEELTRWFASQGKDNSCLLSGDKLRVATEWANGKSLEIDDYNFLFNSQRKEIITLGDNYQLEQQRLIKKLDKSRTIKYLGSVIILLLFGFTSYMMFSTKRIQAFLYPYILKPEIFSQGEESFFLGNGNIDQNEGVDEFSKGNFAEAKKRFEEAKNFDRKDPEPEIYYNNALAREQGDYFSLAVAVPINARRPMAHEILQGIAQAQLEFNRDKGINGKLLNIVIADDKNDREQAQIVAQEFRKDDQVLGVVGHNSSSITIATLPEYTKQYFRKKLPIISATSTSTDQELTENDHFFRTVPSDAKSGKLLAETAKDEGIKRVVIFYAEGDAYSETLKEEFSQEFKKANRNGVVREKNLGDKDIDPTFEIYSSVVINKADAVVFFPSIELIPTVIKIVRDRKQQNIPKNLGSNLKMLGGDSLYGRDTLKLGGKALEGMILAVPYHQNDPKASSFTKKVCDRWEEVPSWRTAAAYDATKAFLEAIRKSVENGKELTRQNVRKHLQNLQLQPEGTSGDALKFEDGEPSRKPEVVQVVSNSNQENNKCSPISAGGVGYQKLPSQD